MYGETFYGRHTAQHQLQCKKISNDQALAANRMNSSFPNRWSFSYLKFTKYVTNIIAEPKYKHRQQEQ